MKTKSSLLCGKLKLEINECYCKGGMKRVTICENGCCPVEEILNSSKISIVKRRCKRTWTLQGEKKATDFDSTVTKSAEGGHIEIVRLCR